MKRSGWVTFVATIALSFVVLAPARANDLNDILDSPVSVQFEQTTLADVILFFTEEFDINIVVDSRVVAKPGTEFAKPYVTDGKVPYLNLKGVELRAALKALLTPLSLDFLVQQNYIWISTLENIRHEGFEDLETRTYSVPNLQVQDVNADTGRQEPASVDVLALLSRVVPDILEPVTKRHLSYVRYNEVTKQLVVHNTPTNLRRVEQLLEIVSGNSLHQQ